MSLPYDLTRLHNVYINQEKYIKTTMLMVSGGVRSVSVDKGMRTKRVEVQR